MSTVPSLEDHHYAMLSGESGIADAAIADRGYYTALTPDELAALGFADFQRCAPALVIPIYDVHGKICTPQIRPDTPRRAKKGKILKYDTPQGSQITLDIHPALRPSLGQVDVPLIIIEGIKKADSITSRVTPTHPLCVVGLIGVYGWMRNKQPLPDWRAIAMQQREVIIVFDSDVLTTPEVQKARNALATFLAKQGAHVKHVDLPLLPQGKCGADDYFVAGHSLEDLLGLAVETFPRPRPVITTLADVEEQPLEWTWWPYLPKAALVMLDGDPGTGKSLFTIQLAAILSRGWPLPDQQGQLTLQTGKAQHTLLMSAEDSISATIKKRCRECGGDDSKIHIFTEWRDTNNAMHPFTLKEVAMLDEVLAQRPYGLLIIDPIQAFLGPIDMHRSNETRPVLQALSKMLERYKVTAICVRHPAKPGQGAGKAIYRGLGSIDFIGAARSGLFVEQHPVDETKVLICHMKTNVGMFGRTQVFTKRNGIFAWAGVSRMTAELVAGNARGPDPVAFFEAYCWLETTLESGILQPSDDLLEQGQEEGIAEKTLKRAKKALGVRSSKQGKIWYCRLPPLPFIPLSPKEPGPLGPLGPLDPPDPLDPLPSAEGMETEKLGDEDTLQEEVQEVQESQEWQVGQEGQVIVGGHGINGIAAQPGSSNGATQEETCPQCGEAQPSQPEALPDGSTAFRCARCGGVMATVPF
jgi:hypothetical protein